MIDIHSLECRKIECARHFLYFPTEKLAKAAGALLGDHAHSLDVSFSAYSSQWLLLIHEKNPGEESFRQSRARFEEVAESFQGEYDGWEFEIRNAIH